MRPPSLQAPMAPDVLCVCLGHLQEALTTDSATCQSLFAPSDDSHGVHQLAVQMQGSASPLDVAKLMVLWLTSAPRFVLPMDTQVALLMAAAKSDSSSCFKELQVQFQHSSPRTPVYGMQVMQNNPNSLP